MKILFQDEARFGLITDIYRLWAKRGTRPLVAQQHSYQYSYAYSTVCPATGEIYPLIAPMVNTDIMNIFLKAIADHYTKYMIIIFMDRAGWHRSKGLQLPNNIHIELLPPYSPELNPAEQLWKYVRLNHTGNSLFATIDALDNVLANSLTYLINNPLIVKSFSYFPWIKHAEL